MGMDQITELIGATCSSVTGGLFEQQVTFVTDKGTFKMCHLQDCCEEVVLEDVNGDLQDLVGHEILAAEETSNEEEGDCEHETWTFYHIRTLHTTITLRWYGTSNGYYSEGVDFYKVDEDGKYLGY